MRKAKRFLTSFLAVVLVLSSMSFGSLTVNANEGNDGTIVEEQNQDQDQGLQSPSQNEPGNGSVSDDAVITLASEDTSLEDDNSEQEKDGDIVESSNEVIYNFNQLGSPVGGYGYEVTVDETTGAATFAFNNDGGYGEAIYNLPADIDTSKVEKAELVFADGTGVWIKLYLLSNGGGYEKNEYNQTGDYTCDWGASATPKYQFKSIGITSPDAQNTATISGLKLTFGDVNLSEKEAPKEETKDEPADVEVITYSFADLAYESKGPEVVVAEDGSATVTAADQYSSVFMTIPAEVADKAIQKVIFNVTSDTASTYGYKVFAAENFASAMWGDGVTVTEENPYAPYGNPVQVIPEGSQSGLGYLGLTSAEAGASIVISGVTFECVENTTTDEGTETPGGTTEVVDGAELVTYAFGDLKYESYGPSVVVGEDGSATVTAATQYESLFITIPEELTNRKIQKITFNVTSNTASSYGYKAFLADGFASAMWGDGVTVTDQNPYAPYGNPVQTIPDGYQKGLGYLALTSTAAEASITISGVTFECVVEGPMDKTYSFGELAYESYGPSVAVAEDGSATVTAATQYESVFITIPEELTDKKIQKVTFNVTSDTASTYGYKAFLAEGFAGAMWGDGVTVTEQNPYAPYGNPVQMIPDGFQKGLGYLALTSTEAGASIDISGITFTYVIGDDDDDSESAITYGDNIVKNPYFAEEDLSVWSMGASNAKVSAATAAEAIFDEVSTYGVIDRDAEWNVTDEEGKILQDARHEFFAQDITTAIEAGGDLNRGPEYKVEFWAKLSDDYAGAADDQRVVEFAPYIVTEQDGTVYLGASYSDQLSGNLSQTLTVGEWTKFSGTFNVKHQGTIKQVVIRIIEQGTEYGDIAAGAECVKGDYYITGVSMTEVFRPKTVIEYDIPNWKDAITAAFGSDAIAGTCLGSGTITYEYLQELAKKHFNAITFENEMKPDATLGSTPNIGSDGFPIYNFTTADRMLAQIKAWNDADPNVDFKIRGHVLVWHSQTPEWFFHEDYDTSKGYVKPEVMNARMEHYIAAVFNHYEEAGYSDMFYGWDVVNEAMSDSTGKPRMAAESSSWAAVYGDQSNEYIINAFRYANKYADSSIKLYYNDYNDSNEPKASGIAQLVKDIKAAEGTRIDGVGMQAHHNFSDPTVGQIKSAINKYLEALGEGGTVQMTELDVKASSTFDGTAATLESEHNKQAWRFKEIFDAYRAIEAEKPGSVGGITMWGITDESSWLQSSNSVGGSSSGGVQAPLLFYIKDYKATAKPAFYAFFKEYEDKLPPMIQNVTVMQQMEEGNFDIAKSYKIGEVATFAPMWTEDGLMVKVNVTDATNDGASDNVTVYIDEAGSKSEGEYAKATVSRESDGVTSTDSGYEAIITIPMTTGSAKTFSMDIAVDNNGDVSVFNDKKGTHATSSQYYAEAIMKPYAVIANGSVTVDAEYDAAWDNAKEIPLSIVQGAEATATVKALWDAEYLYVYADIKDAVLDATSSQVHEKDSLEVFIDENNAKADSYEADDKQYRVNYLNEQTFNGEKCVAENIESAVKEVEGGYIIEAAYKWTDITPADGMEIGMEFQINDAKNGARTGTASWYDTSGNGWSSPSVFGTVVLSDGSVDNDEPTTPEKPEGPKPGKPEAPSKPEAPKPNKPAAPKPAPGKPAAPVAPEAPSAPTPPTPPVAPEAPSKPETPAKPAKPAVKETVKVEEDKVPLSDAESVMANEEEVNDEVVTSNIVDEEVPLAINTDKPKMALFMGVSAAVLVCGAGCGIFFVRRKRGI